MVKQASIVSQMRFGSGVRCQCDQFGIQLFEFRRGIGNAKIELRKVGSVHGKIASYEPSKFPSLGFTIETKSQNGTTKLRLCQ